MRVDFLLLHAQQLVFVREQNVLLMRNIRATNLWHAYKDVCKCGVKGRKWDEMSEQQ